MAWLLYYKLCYAGFWKWYKKFVRKISGNWTSYVANPRHTYAIFKVYPADMSITNFYITLEI